MQYRYDYKQQGREAFHAGQPRSSCPDRLALPATYALHQVQDARQLWCIGYDEAQRAAAAAQATAPA